jgi:hypothetical protein
VCIPEFVDPHSAIRISGQHPESQILLSNATPLTNMITPVFRVEQDVEFVRVLITAPHLNLAAVDFAIDGSQFKFVSHP